MTVDELNRQESFACMVDHLLGRERGKIHGINSDFYYFKYREARWPGE